MATFDETQQIADHLFDLGFEVSKPLCGAIVGYIEKQQVEARVDECRLVPFDVDHENVHWTYFRDRVAQLKENIKLRVKE
jgi:hypothetical protein